MMLARVAPKLRLRRREELGDEEGEGEVRRDGATAELGRRGLAGTAEVYIQSKIMSKLACSAPCRRLEAASCCPLLVHPFKLISDS